MSILPFTNIDLLNIYIGVSIAWKGHFSAVFEFSRDPRHQREVMKCQNLQRKVLRYSHLEIQIGPHPTSRNPTRKPTQTPTESKHPVWCGCWNSTEITPPNIPCVWYFNFQVLQIASLEDWPEKCRNYVKIENSVREMVLQKKLCICYLIVCK